MCLPQAVEAAIADVSFLAEEEPEVGSWVLRQLMAGRV